MKKVVIGVIMLGFGVHGISNAAACSGALSVAQLNEELPKAIAALRAQFDKLSDEVILKLSNEVARVSAVVSDPTKDYSDKFVDLAMGLNQIAPVLERLVGSSKADVLGHKETGALDEINAILKLMGKEPLSSTTIAVLQEAVAKLEAFSTFLTNTAPSFKGLKP